MNSSAAGHGNVGMLQIAILVLSLVALAGLAADTVFEFPPPVSQVIQGADTVVCVILLCDFFARFFRAKSKLEFMKWGWIDLIASIPNWDVLRWGRLTRVLRIIRLLRGVRSVHRVLQMVLENRMRGGAVSLGLVAFLLITFSSVSVLVVERHEGSNIKSAEDALWWSVTTMTTVGYGDKYPVTTEGRVIGIVLMVCGVGMFAGLSGLIASLFLGGQDRHKEDLGAVIRKLDEIEKRLPSAACGANQADEPENKPG